MKYSKMLIPTVKEVPAEAEIVSHQLMIRAGLIRKLASGTYSYLPIGQKILLKVIAIVRQEMNAAGAQEITMPILQPMELWEKTGRNVVFKDIMCKFEDRHGRWNVLAPTAEEVVTAISSLIPRVLDTVNTMISAIAAIAPDIIRSLVTAIVANLPMLIDSAVGIVQTLLGGIIDALPQLTQGALQLVLALVDGIIQNLPEIVQAALTVIVTLADGIGDSVGSSGAADFEQPPVQLPKKELKKTAVQSSKNILFLKIFILSSLK